MRPIYACLFLLFGESLAEKIVDMGISTPTPPPSSDISAHSQPAQYRLIVEWKEYVPPVTNSSTRQLKEDTTPSKNSYLKSLPSRKRHNLQSLSNENASPPQDIQVILNEFFDGKAKEDLSIKTVGEMQQWTTKYHNNILSLQRLNLLGMDIIELDTEDAMLRLYEDLLTQDDNVLAVHKDEEIYINARFSDPFYEKQWYLDTPTDKDINYSEMSSYLETNYGVMISNDILVAVLDTGVALNHSDLKASLWVNEAELNGEPGVDDDNNGYIDDVYGYDFYNRRPLPEDDNFHGSHCAGVLGAQTNNNVGIVGIATPKIMSLKIMDARGNGSFSAAVAAINYAYSKGAQLTSNSWGGTIHNALLGNAMKNAKNTLHVCAAGNDTVNNDRVPQYPASYTLQTNNVISIGATTKTGERASYTNYGLKSVDLFAPGSDILSTCLNNTYCLSSGTSMATPVVTGIAVWMLRLSRELVRKSGTRKEIVLSPGDMKKILVDTVRKMTILKNYSVAGGIVDAMAAMKGVEKWAEEWKDNKEDGQCVYLEWGPWSACSATCGEGERWRERQLERPTEGCVEVDRVTEKCQSAGCECKYSEWSEWSACSNSCGQGVKERTREWKGGDAEKCSALKETMNCQDLSPCPVDCRIGEWSDWSSCSRMCGPGTRTRQRLVTRPLYGGKACSPDAVTLESQACDNKCECKVGDWSEWGNCSASCGTGVRKRTRPTNNYCDATTTSTDIQICDLPRCIKKNSTCELSEWSQWGDCSTSCDPGLRSRERKYLVVKNTEILSDIDHSEEKCPQPTLIESDICNIEESQKCMTSAGGSSGWLTKWYTMVTSPVFDLLTPPKASATPNTRSMNARGSENIKSSQEPSAEYTDYIKIKNSICTNKKIQVNVTEAECHQICEKLDCACFDVRNNLVSSSFSDVFTCQISTAKDVPVSHQYLQLGLGSTAYLKHKK